MSKPNTIGGRIRHCRQQAGWTQVDLAEAAGTTQDHISALEHDKHEPSLELLQRLADALGAKRSRLIG